MVIVLINNDAVRNLAVYPIHLLLLGASFMCARSVYRFLDPEWDKRKKQVGDKSYVNWRAFIAAVLIFLAVGTFLEALPTHQMARSFSHESFND